MTGFAEYDRYDALGLAELVKRGEVSPVELLEEAIERRNRINPFINAVILDMGRQARETLRQGVPDGPFSGVPFLIKDLLAAYAGVPLTSGSRAYRHYIPDFDSEMVKRYKASGAVIFGKTNTPEFGLMGVTEPALYGITRNPWHLERTPGGSSGGAAAAVAAGIVPMASGGDGGGSLRIPASCCGLVGFKATRGRNPHGPAVSEPWFGQVQEGVISRSVRDTAAMLDATHGPDQGALYAAPSYSGRFLDEVSVAPGRLRIAWTAEPLLRDGVMEPECLKGLEATVRLLESLGHEVVEAAPVLDKQALAEGYLLRIAAATAGEVGEAERTLGRRLTLDDFETETWSLVRLGQSFTAGALDNANRLIYGQLRRFDAFMQGYDVFLTPTLASPPPGFGEFRLKGAEKWLAPLAKRFPVGPLVHLLPILTRLAEQNFRWVTSTPVMNMSGHPSVSLPLHWTTDNLPVGMMFTGRFGDEATLFRLAGQLEKASPWAHRCAPVHAGSSGLK
ncbi:amidase [Fluviicoccus keumensis]|uniref:Amidase n=1 Tax=Fluviicoccus keumensis TaxID=1435465 RepID=A0A4Q7YKB6_9GAMM|nr:amidase [Fluviicoccus keumensis]RZU37101.1 amidase [Fluviicoccus keumensis]